ncbi:hypothetical protein MRX96_047165 [Rhipicephalus microplus]
MPEAMVDGETITEEEASAPGWIDAIRRRGKSSTTTTGKLAADAQAIIPDSTDEAPAYHHQEPDCNAYLGRSSHR